MFWPGYGGCSTAMSGPVDPDHNTKQGPKRGDTGGVARQANAMRSNR